MRWLILIFDLLLAAAVIYLRCRFGSPGRFLFSCCPLPESYRKKMLRKLEKTEPASPKSPQERLLEHCAAKADALLGITVAGLLVIFLLSFAGHDARPVTELARSDEAQELLIEGGVAGQKAEGLVVELPAAAPSQKDKILWLGEADEYIDSYFRNLGVLTEAPVLPKSWGHASFSYYSLDEEYLDNDGNFFGSWPEEAHEAPFRVVVWVEDMKSAVDVRLSFAPASELSEQSQWELVKKRLNGGVFLEDDALRLPETADGGAALSWREPSTRISLLLCLVLLGLILALVAGRMDGRLDDQLKARRLSCEAEGPEVISEYLLYLGAGLSPQNAWLRLTDEYEAGLRRGAPPKALREEMKLESARLRSGMSFAEILADFAEKSLSQDARRMARLLNEERSLGNRMLAKELKSLCDTAWEERRRSLRERVEKADTRLLLPIMLMFCVILVITVAPALMNIKGM